MAASTLNMNGVSRTLSYQYDAAGARTRVTHPDGQFTQIYRDNFGRIYYTALNASVPQFHTPYDNLGRQSATWRWTGGGWNAPTGYGHDGMNRLNVLTQDPSGTGWDMTASFAYNPASQLTSRTQGNDGCAWTGHVNVERPYIANGLNQFSSVSGVGFNVRIASRKTRRKPSCIRA